MATTQRRIEVGFDGGQVLPLRLADEEDAVRRKQPVRLGAAPELARDEHAHDRGRRRHDEQRHRGERPAAE